jgi:hypothetical protein
MLPLACLTLGVLLGLIGGLKISFAILDPLKRRIEWLERSLMQKETPP